MSTKMMNFRRSFARISLALLGIMILSCLAAAVPARATALYSNPDTGYRIQITDEADLLSPDEEALLKNVMQPITAYGNVAFESINENYTTAEYYARDSYENTFGKQSGILFLVDMDNRYLFMRSDGLIYETVTSSEMETITDNVYTYASNEDYYRAAATAFEQVYALLEGRDIPRPMKYIGNAVFSIMIGMLIAFIIVSINSSLKSAGVREMLASASRSVGVKDPTEEFDRETKRYSPVESSSSGSSSSYRSSGGSSHSSHSSGGHSSHSSGGHSGGGGGHRF
ncbi:MAG: TPM domain-containing protein [Lachnospiraceae bacterium]|nr:TPM domain-containing protein [Lachnospiraceae bacterium]